MSKLDFRTISLDLISEWATERQVQVVTALQKHGDTKTTAEVLGISQHRVRGILSVLRKKAAVRGITAEQILPVPPDFLITKMTLQCGPDGSIERTWPRVKPGEEARWNSFLEALEEAKESFEGFADPLPPPKEALREDLLAAYTLGDPHIGMFADAAETRDKPWDLDIAKSVYGQAVDSLVGRAMAAKYALVATVGDTAHVDNAWNKTMRSGHIQDVSQRWPAIYRMTVHIFIQAVYRALEKHDFVHVISAMGNHDDMTAYALAVCLDAWFRNEPRVTVDLHPGKFHYHQFGEVLLGYTHGNGLKIPQLPAVMAADVSKAWGDTTYRHWYTGHRHTQQWHDFPGVSVEVCPTLAPLDNHAAGCGYRSRQDMKCDVYHMDGSWVNRHVENAANLKYAEAV